MNKVAIVVFSLNQLFGFSLKINFVFKNQILNIWPISAYSSCDNSATYLFLYIFKVHLQSQPNSKQCVEGS